MKNDVLCVSWKREPSQDSKHLMPEFSDFKRFPMPQYWWHALDVHGEGRTIGFPVKLRANLGGSPKHFALQDRKLIQAPQITLENVSVTINIIAMSSEVNTSDN